ncbi:N6-L-threonylcarbamoyladenine synthase [Verrucomicrobium sp. GAS474]|uniref:tRNA (adenosine(37)-N6)-threonylcarbamoyltransferase complex transferase subunit TsaD n=1 Tax=Verrucomicrobium sp. GAS474 TaxID=1882831 RepID=UPI00087C84D0|nr:tRNA (adenosine(37)-N6)-threonylcarbamoyltransferase complex transferase subunit TsaD [Verrucomicrobium sp. GAS474]SDU09625.1 N6-L-threonylcarbamoyladenine synthase [Verrucomicrobium sp. GAS474]
MRWLGIETSCDESAVAVVEVGGAGGKGLRLLSSVVGSQIARHRPFGGVVPEVAVREHLRNLPRLAEAALAEARLGTGDLDGIAVTQGPGLATSLLIGHAYARGLGLATGLPVRGVNHLEGHLLSPFLTAEGTVPFPFLGLIVSGGHTLLIEARGWNDYRRLGGTVDDAAGEVFDKVARMLSLGYPGGPEIEKAAAQGDAAAHDFPRAFPERADFRFSFSGLKTSVRYFLEKTPEKLADPRFVADVAASFQKAVVDVLVRKASDAARTRNLRTVIAAGGVACNGALRAALERESGRAGYRLLLAPPVLCTDNAAMIAGVAALKEEAGAALPLPDDIDPNLPLASV